MALCGIAVWGVWHWVTRTPFVAVEQCSVTGDPDTALDTGQSRYAALVVAGSVRRGLPPRAATIALATAMQESKLRNLDHGDRDSLGLFQQRPSQGWGTEAQLQDPHYATDAFYAALVKVHDWGTRPITDVAQDVQRSALPTAYATHETFGRHWASALTGYSPAALTCRLRPATTAGDPATLTTRLERDYGNAVTVSSPSRDGSAPYVTVRADGTGAAARRGAWSVAAWAVANAATLGVDEVHVADRVWTRADPSTGWTHAPTDTRPAAGAVRVVMATADR